MSESPFNVEEFDREYPGVLAAACALRDTPEWEKLKRHWRLESNQLAAQILEMNPYEGPPMQCGQTFLYAFFELQRGIRARAHAVLILDNLAQAHIAKVQETDDGR